jgi:iron complex outermembrane receptor protein
MKKVFKQVLSFTFIISVFFCSIGFGHPILGDITGKVTSVSGEGLPAVSVGIKGTKRGTSTDGEGNFRIVAEKGDVLIFSFVGYTKKEWVVGDEVVLKIVLEESSSQLSEIIVVGSRGLPRTDVDRPVPIDVLNSKELQTTGQVELTQQIQFNSPSFNSAKTGINGVANYADPATLRGLSPDQILVLVDGKRRHQFSALNLNVTVGLGTVVTDMNSVPALAINQIEILRDGAAAQYGSDAIAGIVNMGLKREVGKGTFQTQYGITKEGDGGTYTAGLNYGFKIGKTEKSFLNLTLQYQDAKGTDRSDAYNPQPVPGGTYTGIYSNNKTIDESTRVSRGKYGAYGTFSPTQFGSNATKAYQGFYNLGLPVSKNWNFYSFGGFSRKEVQAFGFFRVATPTNPNSNPDIFPDGYAPELPGTTQDYSTVVGFTKKNVSGWNLDFSTGYGVNYLDLWANNTTNPSMGAKSPTNFYVGRSIFGQSTTDWNVSRNFKNVGVKSLNLAFGGQYRVDRFVLEKGSPESYQVGELALTKNKAPGSSGRPGIAPEDETDVNRSNIGVYADIESDITQNLLFAGAIRYENYSDFGGNFSGKLASRLKLTETVSIRGSINKGFRAPSLQQTYNSVTTSTVQAGNIIQTKQLPNNDPRLEKIGIEKPQAETSWNYSLGITAKAGRSFLFTLDAYQIDIQNRIILSERMIVNNIAALKPLFPGISEIRFFTNHVNTRTRGIDFVTSFKHSINSKNKVTASLALTVNETKIVAQKPTPNLLQAGTTARILMIDTVSISLIETAQPRQKAHMAIGYQWGKLTLNTRLSYFGPVTVWEKPTGKPHITQTFGGKTLMDLSLVFAPRPEYTFTLGSNNITNVYPDRVALNFAGYSNGQIPITRNANQFGFNGAFYYANFTLNF